MVANIKAENQDDLIYKSMIATIYEDGHKQYLRFAMQEGQFISWSVAMDFAGMNIHRAAA